MASLAALGHPPSDELLDTYADAANLISERDLEQLQETDRAQAAEHAVVSTLLLEPVLLILRRVAQENSSRRRRRDRKTRRLTGLQTARCDASAISRPQDATPHH